MKVLTAIENLQALFFLKRHVPHTFISTLKNVTCKPSYTLFSFGLRLAYLNVPQNFILKIKHLHNFHTKEMALVCTNTQRKTLQQNMPTICPPQYIQGQI